MQASEVESESNIFCRICLTNQSFYVRALADYLPEDDDPRYAELEAALPTFKKELDLRFPRCCVDCAPRVEAQIKQANYRAKSDHVRRMVKRSNARTANFQVGVRNIIVTAAGLGYAYSLLTQILWHALASQSETDSPISGVPIRQCLKQWPVPGECSAYAASTIPTSLLIGLLCIWWNPHWQQRLKGREGRLAGLRRYYFLQVLTLVVRFAVWILVEDFAGTQMRPQILHIMALVSITMCTIYTVFGVIKLDTTPLVDWRNVQQPLVNPDQFRPPPAFIPTPENSQSQQFSFNSLAGPSREHLQAWRPPTPPDYENGMDWVPTGQDFNPRQRIIKQKFEQPSPFHGNLPAAPSRGALYHNRAPPPERKQALGLAPGFFGLSKPADGTTQSPLQTKKVPDNSFAPATFFAHEREADTGLENIFDKMFSVRDSRDARINAVEKTSASQAQTGSTIFERNPQRCRFRSRSHVQVNSDGKPAGSLTLTCAIIISLTVAISVLCTREMAQDLSNPRPYQFLAYTIAIPAAHELEAAFYTGALTTRTMLTSCIEFAAPILGQLCLPSDGSPFISSWNKLVIGILCLFLLLELYNFAQLQNTPVSSAATAQMVSSMEKVERETDAATSHPSPPYQYSFTPIHKTNSNESLASTSSVQTTSTVAGWKTPKTDARTFNFQTRRPSPPITHGFGGLSLSNDFGSGANIVPRRNR